VASSTSIRIEVTRAEPGHRCTQGMTTCEDLPCRGAAITTTESSVDTAKRTLSGTEQPSGSPTSVNPNGEADRLGRTTGPRLITAVSARWSARSLRVANPSSRRLNRTQIRAPASTKPHPRRRRTAPAQ
jgi:hypothetical protein